MQITKKGSILQEKMYLKGAIVRRDAGVNCQCRGGRNEGADEKEKLQFWWPCTAQCTLCSAKGLRGEERLRSGAGRTLQYAGGVQPTVEGRLQGRGQQSTGGRPKG